MNIKEKSRSILLASVFLILLLIYISSTASASTTYVSNSAGSDISTHTEPYIFVTEWGSYGSEDGQFGYPIDVAVDSLDNVYVVDYENNRIQKFDGNGNFITKWGSYGTEDGKFSYPIDVAVDSLSNVYVADYENNRIQKFDSNGNFITKWGSGGSEDGQFSYPWGVAVDSSGNVYVVDNSNYRIQKFSSDGTYIAKWGSEGSQDGQFSYPIGIAVDTLGNVYVADYLNQRIQKFDSNGNFITKWGSEGSQDGQFSYPVGVAVDSSGNVYVADFGNNRIQKFSGDGTYIAKWGSEGSQDGQFSYPVGVAVDSSDNVYVADYENHRIQKFASIETPEPSGPFYNPENGHYYNVIIAQDINWKDAKDAAQSLSYLDMNGHLATITSQDENDFIVNNIDGDKCWWLGGYQPDDTPDSMEPDGNWHWVTEEKWDYTNWPIDRPDNAWSGQNCLALWSGKNWDDASTDDLGHISGYIVEYETPAPAREITVGNNSEADFISIQEAVNNSVPGNTIIVKPGTYTENVLVNVPELTIRSESNHGSVQVKPLDESKSTFMTTADNITISGLNIVGPSQDYEKSAIFIYGDMNNLTGNTIENGCILLGPERRGTLIAENKISNGEGEGIHISCCGFDTNVVSNNTISNCSTGIYEYDQAADIRNNRITDCNYGIMLSGAYGGITNNTILNCDIGILLGESCYVDITNNKIMFCEECGIFDQENFGGQRIYNNYFNNNLNIKLESGEGGNTWNTSLTQGTNIAGGPYIVGNFWAKPDGTGFSQTSVDMDENGIGDLPYNIYEDEFDYLPLVSLSSPQNPVIPTANFTTSITNGTAPLLVQFTDFSENALEWNWDFGDGTNSIEQNPAHTYLVAGNYTVTLTVSNIEGIDSKLSTITVSGPVLPDQQNFSSNATNVYAPVNVQIGNLSQNATTINWNIGSQHLGTNFSGNRQNVSAPVIVQIDNASQNATTINWNIYSI